MATTIKISEAARAVLARSTITATTVALPDEVLERKLYVEVDKALKAAGGKWSKKRRVHEFTSDPREALGLTLETGTAVNHRQLKQAFYTPSDLAARVVEAAAIGPGMTVLEPSCGEGSLIAAVLAAEPDVMVQGYDTDPQALDRIPSDPRVTLECRDFMAVDRGRFDRVVMNPPFSKGQDVEHVTHALRFLKPGGVLVAIMLPTWQTSKRVKAVDFRGRLGDHEVEPIEAGAFKSSGTTIATVMLKVRG